jgi:signal transduction histidine kinase
MVDPAEDRLTPARREALRDATREALTNVAKHSGASKARVRIGRRAEVLRVEIADDGDGGADADGAGLTGLRQRVEALDGRLEIDSPLGLGTLVRAELPCVS